MWKYLTAWFVMLLISVANGSVRDFTYGRHMSELASHQLSSVTEIALLGVVVRAFIQRYPPSSGRDAIALGALWMALTVAFEFLFFHYVGGHSWSALLGNYDLLQGRVWVLVLAWLAVAPYLFFRLALHARDANVR